jgi:hypothetical protein
MGIFNWVKKKQDAKKQKEDEEKLLREQVFEEIGDEIIEIRKNKIKEEILAKERGEKVEGKSDFFKKLGQEFSPLGTNTQMDKLLGKQTTQQTQQTNNNNIINNDKISQMIGVTNKDVTKKDIAGIMGYDKKLRDDGVQVIGGSPVNEDKIRRFTSLGSNTNEEKLKNLLKRKI